MKKIGLIAVSFVAAVVAVSSVGLPVSASVPGNNGLVTMKHDNTQAKSTYVAPDNPLPSMSRDGNFALFFTNASDDALVTPVATKQVVVRNLQTGVNELASVNTSGVEANQAATDATISEDGQFVIFNSTATNLTTSTNGYKQTYIRDRINNTVEIASTSSAGVLANATTFPRAVSNDGRFVLFYTSASSLGASQSQLFVKDMVTSELKMVSRSDSGTPGDASTQTGSMSCDGSFVAFTSAATNLVPNDPNTTNTQGDVFLVDLRNGFSIEQLTATATKLAYVTDISCNGNYIAFHSASIGLTPETVTGTYTHAFLYNRLGKTTAILDKNYANNQVSPATAGWPAVSDKGQVIFTASPNTGLVSSPYHGGKKQTYIRDTKTGVTYMLSVTSSGTASNNDSQNQNAITSDGSRALYLTSSTNLSSTTDSNNASDLYISDTGF